MTDNNRQWDFRAQRDGWQIAIEAREVHTAATAKREHHEKRLEFWRKREADTEDKIRTEGIVFHQTSRQRGQHALFAMSATSAAPSIEKGVGASRRNAINYKNEIEIDPKLEADLLEAQEKVDTHLAQVRAFLTWEKLLSLMPPTTRIPLTIQDVEFFDMGEAVNYRIPERELETSQS